MKPTLKIPGFLLKCTRLMQVLVELAMEREEDIPALIYEARPVVRPWGYAHSAAPWQASSCLQAYTVDNMASKQHVPKPRPPTL